MLYEMKDNEYKPRKKAFIGAIISTAASVAGGIISARKKRIAAKREAARQEAIKRNEDIVRSTEALNAGLQGQDELQDDFLEQYMKYGGKTSNGKYKDRTKKSIGGIADILNGVIGGAGTIASATTDNPVYATAGQGLGQAVGQGLIQYNNKRLAEQRKDKLEEVIPINGINTNYDANLPTNLQPIKRYGGRYMPMVVGSKGVKTKPRRL